MGLPHVIAQVLALRLSQSPATAMQSIRRFVAALLGATAEAGMPVAVNDLDITSERLRALLQRHARHARDNWVLQA